MKSLLTLVLTSSLLLSSFAFAHSDGHGKVDDKKIIQAAQTLAKTLTFKDKGMSVGKLDSTWNKVAKEKFEVVEKSADSILVKATNPQISQTLFFVVSKGGKVLEVKEKKVFKHDHGHAH